MIFDWCYGKRLARIETKINHLIIVEEQILAMFADVKAAMDALVAAIETFIAKFEGGELVSMADMQAAVDEMKAEMDKIKAIP